MKQYSFLIENWRTNLLLKYRPLRKAYGQTLKFANSKYAFPIVMHTYGWATIALPSGSVYAIALGSVPKTIRKEVLYKLRHAKSPKDTLEVLKTLNNSGIEVIKSAKEKISDFIVPKIPNLMQYAPPIIA